MAETHGSPCLVYAEVQNESIWAVKSQAAAARGGAREGRPRGDLERVQCLVGVKPTGKSLVNYPYSKHGAEERLRGEAIEAESGK